MHLSVYVLDNAGGGVDCGAGQTLDSNDTRCRDIVAQFQAAGLSVVEAWVVSGKSVGVRLGHCQVTFAALVECLAGFRDLDGVAHIQGATLSVAMQARVLSPLLPAPSRFPHTGGWGVVLALGGALLWAATTMAPYVDTAVGTVPVPGLTPVFRVLLQNFVNALGR